jgi:hypothetical protein
MHETATLHFDLSNLSPDQPFTLHVGSRRYDLAPQTRHTLARSRRDMPRWRCCPIIGSRISPGRCACRRTARRCFG